MPSVIEKKIYLKKDGNQKPIPTGRTFQTKTYTITAADTLEAIALDDEVAEVLLRSDAPFKYAHASDADAVTPPAGDVVELTVLDMSSLYVQGTAGQVIEITETRV